MIAKYVYYPKCMRHKYYLQFIFYIEDICYVIERVLKNFISHTLSFLDNMEIIMYLLTAVRLDFFKK